VLDRWCLAFDSFAVRSPNGAWVLEKVGRLVGWLVACICRIQTVGCGWSIRDERGGKQRFDGSRQE